MLPVTLVSLLLVVLSVVLLLVILAGLAILFPKSFWGEQARTALTWRPPFVQGGVLRSWAAKTSERITRERLSDKRDRSTAVQLARDVEEGAMRAMLPGATQSELGRRVACPESGQGIVGVTAPEALAIAVEIRKSHSRAEQKEILDMAIANAREIEALPPGGAMPELRCPLQGPGQMCCVYGERPLRCRPLHAILAAKSMADEHAASGVPQAEPTAEERPEEAVAQGVEIGLTRALKSAGLDGEVYELNSALVVALEKPDAAERWASGGNVFGRCRRMPGPTD